MASPEAHAEQMAQRRALLLEHRDQVLVDDVSSRDAQAELLDLITEHLARQHPERFAITGAGEDRHFHSRAEGLCWRFADYAESPLLLAGQLVQEELCLMHEEMPSSGKSDTATAAAHIFAAGVVIDSFNPAEKHLLPMLELHDPVPGYATDLHAGMGRVFASLRKPLWRANFAFAEWQLEEEEGAAQIEDDIATRLYLKVEYETLRRLPLHRDYLVFTIRTYFDPLPSLATTPLACAALATEIRCLPQALLEYRGLGHQSSQRAVLRFLDGICEQNGISAGSVGGRRASEAL